MDHHSRITILFRKDEEEDESEEDTDDEDSDDEQRDILEERSGGRLVIRVRLWLFQFEWVVPIPLSGRSSSFHWGDAEMPCWGVVLWMQACG